MSHVRKRKWVHGGEIKTAWVVSYADNLGKRRQRTFDTKKAADKHRLQVDNEVDQGIHTASGDSKTVEEACEAFIRLQEDRKREGQVGHGALCNHKTAIDKNIVPYLGKVKLSDLRREHVEDAYRKTVRDLKLKPETARARFRTLKQVQDYAIKRGWLRTKPVNDGLSDLGRASKETIRTFKTSEVLNLLKTLEKGRPAHGQTLQFEMTRCLVHIAAFCGLRLGEIGALRTADVDVTQRIIRVRQSRTIWGEIKGPKTKAGVRDVPMPRHVAKLLEDWLTDHRVANAADLVFVTRDGTPFKFANFRAYGWTGLLKRAGLHDPKDRFHFHALRHFASSWMLDNRFSLPDVAALMGHSKFDTTLQVYAHSVTTPAHRVAAMDRMSDSLLSLGAPGQRQESSIDL